MRELQLEVSAPLASEIVAGYMLARIFQARCLFWQASAALCCACKHEHLRAMHAYLRDEDSAVTGRHGTPEGQQP